MGCCPGCPVAFTTLANAEPPDRELTITARSRVADTAAIRLGVSKHLHYALHCCPFDQLLTTGPSDAEPGRDLRESFQQGPVHAPLAVVGLVCAKGATNCRVDDAVWEDAARVLLRESALVREVLHDLAEGAVLLQPLLAQGVGPVCSQRRSLPAKEIVRLYDYTIR
jgi:hypothetical protein